MDNLDLSIELFSGEEGIVCVWLKSDRVENGTEPAIYGSILMEKLHNNTSQHTTTYRVATC